jgi:hypothetical protein
MDEQSRFFVEFAVDSENDSWRSKLENPATYGASKY